MTSLAPLPPPPFIAIRDAEGNVTTLIVTVFGTPAPQGSKRAFANRHTGRVQMVESSSKVRPWRTAIELAVTSETGGTLLLGEGPVCVGIEFFLPRPKDHFGTGKNAGALRDSAPTVPAVKPDIDKLLRSTLDGMKSAGAYRDDAQVTRVTMSKAYAGGPGALPIPGARIVVARVA